MLKQGSKNISKSKEFEFSGGNLSKVNCTNAIKKFQIQDELENQWKPRQTMMRPQSQQFGLNSNFNPKSQGFQEWKAFQEIQSIVFNLNGESLTNSRNDNLLFVGETSSSDIGKLSVLQISQEGTALKELHHQRLYKLKQIIKGIEEAKLQQVICLNKISDDSSNNKMPIDLIALQLQQQNCLTALAFIEKQTGDLFGIYHYHREIKSGIIHNQSSNGLICIIQDGMQQFLTHLNPISMQCEAVPLNAYESKFSSLKLININNSSMFGILEDDLTFIVQYIKVQHNNSGPGCIEVETISKIDFSTKFTQPIQEVVPINKTDSVVVKIERKFLIYDYIQGIITEDIQSLRGSDFRVCLDLRYHAELCPEILIYNKNTIRRVDVKTLEIKKNIDIQKIKKAIQVSTNDMVISSVTMVPEFIMPPNNEIVEQAEIIQEFKSCGIESEQQIQIHQHEVKKSDIIEQPNNTQETKQEKIGTQDKANEGSEQPKNQNWKHKYEQIKKLLKSQQNSQYGPDKNCIPRPLVAPTNLGGTNKRIQPPPPPQQAPVQKVSPADVQKQIQILRNMKEPPKQNILQYQSYVKCQQRLLELTRPTQLIFYKKVYHNNNKVAEIDTITQNDLAVDNQPESFTSNNSGVTQQETMIMNSSQQIPTQNCIKVETSSLESKRIPSMNIQMIKFFQMQQQRMFRQFQYEKYLVSNKATSSQTIQEMSESQIHSELDKLDNQKILMLKQLKNIQEFGVAATMNSQNQKKPTSNINIPVGRQLLIKQRILQMQYQRILKENKMLLDEMMHSDEFDDEEEINPAYIQQPASLVAKLSYNQNINQINSKQITGLGTSTGVTTNDTNSSQSSKKQIAAKKVEIRQGNNQFSYVPIPAEKFIIVIGNDVQQFVKVIQA